MRGRRTVYFRIHRVSWTLSLSCDRSLEGKLTKRVGESGGRIRRSARSDYPSQRVRLDGGCMHGADDCSYSDRDVAMRKAGRPTVLTTRQAQV